MSFKNTKSSMDYLEKKGNITSCDVFNIFHNLCDEAEAFGQSKLEKMSCDGIAEEDLVTTLLWCSKKIVRVISKNKEHIKDPFYIEKMENEVTKLNEAIAMLEAEKNEVAQLQERKKQLQDVKTQLDEQIQQKEKLLHECNCLQETIDNYRKEDLQKIQNQKQELLMQEQMLKEQTKKLTDEIISQQTAIQKCIDEKNNAIAQEKWKQQELDKELANQSIALSNEIQQTENKLNSVNAAIAALENRKQALKKQLCDASKEKELLDNWFEEVNKSTNKNNLDVINGQITVLKMAKQNLDREFNNQFLMDGVKLEEQLKEYSDYFEKTLLKVQNELDEYSRKYVIVSDIIYKGGKE